VGNGRERTASYNFSVGRAVENIKRANLQPWRQSSRIPFNQGSFLLSTARPVDAEHDPSRYDLFPTDTLKISGRFFKTSSRVSGIGAPLVAVGREENPQFRQQYKLRRVYAPATAVIQFSGQKADLKFVDPFQVERVALDKRNFPLAVDLSAPTAMLIARERPERLGFAQVINRARASACGCRFGRKGLCQHLRCERPMHESWHRCVHEAIHSARNYSGPVFPQRVKALGYALLHTHRLDPRVEPKLGQHRPLYEAHLIAILRINFVF